MSEQTPVNTSGQTPKKQTNPIVKFFKKVLLFLIFILIAGLTVTYFYYNFTYSEGYRAGMLIKFSQKGFIKTYEGELNLGGINPIPGNTIANNIWKFSVKEDTVATKLLHMEGKIVRLHYKEKVKSFFWQGDTNYFVDGVEEVK